jgi:hypothetical protein
MTSNSKGKSQEKGRRKRQGRHALPRHRFRFSRLPSRPIDLFVTAITAALEL